MTAVEDIPNVKSILEELHAIFGDLPEFTDPAPLTPEEFAAARNRAEETVNLMRSCKTDEQLVKILEEKTNEPCVMSDGTTRPMSEPLRLWQLEFQNQTMFFRNHPGTRSLCESIVAEWYGDGSPLTLYRLMLCLDIKTGAVTLN